MIADLLPWRPALDRWPVAVLLGIGRVVGVAALFSGGVRLLGVAPSPLTTGAAWAAAAGVAVLAGAASGLATWRAIATADDDVAERWVLWADGLVIVCGVVASVAPTLSPVVLLLLLGGLPAVNMALVAPLGVGRRRLARLRALRWRAPAEPPGRRLT